MRVVRMMFLAESRSFDLGEVTDKGSINQRAVLRRLWSDDARAIAIAA